MKQKRKSSFVYERQYNLLEHPEDLLNKYGLKQGLYVYVGSSQSKSFRERCHKWRSHIVAKYKVSRKAIDFIEKYKMFLDNETDLTPKEINEVLYYKGGIVSYHENIENAKKFESHLIGQYSIQEFLNDYEPERPSIFILNQKDSNAIINDNKVKFKTNLVVD
ncbi:MAG: hypothetical protein RSC84_03490 [Peptostreptococcaceae bacterium]